MDEVGGRHTRSTRAERQRGKGDLLPELDDEWGEQGPVIVGVDEVDDHGGPRGDGAESVQEVEPSAVSGGGRGRRGGLAVRPGPAGARAGSGPRETKAGLGPRLLGEQLGPPCHRLQPLHAHRELGAQLPLWVGQALVPRCPLWSGKRGSAARVWVMRLCCPCGWVGLEG